MIKTKKIIETVEIYNHSNYINIKDDSHNIMWKHLVPTYITTADRKNSSTGAKQKPIRRVNRACQSKEAKHRPHTHIA